MDAGVGLGGGCFLDQTDSMMWQVLQANSCKDNRPSRESTRSLISKAALLIGRKVKLQQAASLDAAWYAQLRRVSDVNPEITLAIVPDLRKSARTSTLSRLTFLRTTLRFFCFDVSCLTFLMSMSLLAMTPS